MSAKVKPAEEPAAPGPQPSESIGSIADLDTAWRQPWPSLVSARAELERARARVGELIAQQAPVKQQMDGLTKQRTAAVALFAAGEQAAHQEAIDLALDIAKAEASLAALVDAAKAAEAQISDKENLVVNVFTARVQGMFESAQATHFANDAVFIAARNMLEQSHEARRMTSVLLHQDRRERLMFALSLRPA